MGTNPKITKKEKKKEESIRCHCLECLTVTHTHRIHGISVILSFEKRGGGGGSNILAYYTASRVMIDGK